MVLEEALLEYGSIPMTTEVVMEHLRAYRRPYDKLGELTREGKLIQLKRGLYIAGPSRLTQGAHDYLIANHLLNPSYISLESALAHWGLIPERVYGVSSVTPLRSATFHVRDTPFRFDHVPIKGFGMGQVQHHAAPKQRVLIACAEKALCDLVALQSGLNIRSTKQAGEFLLDDLRVDEDALRDLRVDLITSWLPNLPKQRSIEFIIRFLHTVR